MIPFGASVIKISFFAGVADYMIALIALETDSFCEVELRAEGGCFTTDSFFVEVKSFGALGTLVFDPGVTAIIIGDGDDIGEGNPSISGDVAVEVSIEGVVGEVSVDLC